MVYFFIEPSLGIASLWKFFCSILLLELSSLRRPFFSKTRSIPALPLCSASGEASQRRVGAMIKSVARLSSRTRVVRRLPLVPFPLQCIPVYLASWHYASWLPRVPVYCSVLACSLTFISSWWMVLSMDENVDFVVLSSHFVGFLSANIGG